MRTRPNRRTNYDELNKTFAVFFKEKPRAHWVDRLEANDVPHTPVYNLKEVFDDPQVKHRALIQGVWGNGRIDFGLLSLLARSAEDVLTADRLDVSLRGAVILAGYCADEEVLKSAGDLPLRGMILASMPSSLIPVAMKMQYPIIVLEGFGRIPMNAMAFKLLSTNERREAALNAEPWNRKNGARPEIVIGLPSAAGQSTAREVTEFKAGQTVRSVRAPQLGGIGASLKASRALFDKAITDLLEQSPRDGKSYDVQVVPDLPPAVGDLTLLRQVGVNLTSSDLELTVDGTVNQTVGMRFNGVSIPFR